MSQRQTISQQKLKLRKDIIDWNSKFPIDYIWRKKYGVAFGSPEHRQMSFIDMLFDIEEEIFMRNLSSSNKERGDDSLIPNMTSDKVDELFDDIDITNLDKYNIKTNE